MMYQNRYEIGSTPQRDVFRVDCIQDWSRGQGAAQRLSEVDRFRWAGCIERRDDGLWAAKYHTSSNETDGGLRLGAFEDIAGVFASLEDARDAIAPRYDPERDNVTATRRAS